MRGIKNAIFAGLAGTNITTVGHLRVAPPDAILNTDEKRAWYKKAQNCLGRHEQEEVVRGGVIHQALERIPQFVLEM